jgi:hypothetical protein
MIKTVFMNRFDENKHPRNKIGEFTDKQKVAGKGDFKSGRKSKEASDMDRVNRKNELPNKFSMSKLENIGFAKRMVKDTIWKEAYIEGVNATFLETDMIFDGYAPKGFSVAEINVINNLKHAWEFLLYKDDLENKQIELPTINKINSYIGQRFIDTFREQEGKIRNFPVQLLGVKWQPGIPNMETIYSQIYMLNGIKNPTEKALNLYSTLARGQWYIDGNKRVASLMANRVLIQNGCGILSIPVTNNDERIEFGKLLTDFYETNNPKKLHTWLWENAIKGVKYLNTPNELKEAEEKRKKWNLQHGFAL